MITDENVENKLFEPEPEKEEKKAPKKAAKPQMVKIKLRPHRAIKGLGGPGDVVEVEPKRADYIVGTGYGLYYDEETMAVSVNPF